MSPITVETHCPYCSLQCGMSLHPANGTLLVGTRDFPTNRGGLCEKGWTAAFVEVTYDTGGAFPFKVSTAVRVLPDTLPHNIRRRWALSYGDQIQHLYESVMREPELATEIAPGVTLAELIYAREVEDAMTGEDFLLRRSKLHLTLDRPARDAIVQWWQHSA